MKKGLKNFLNCICFTLIAAVLFFFLGRVFLPKWEEGLAPTTTVEGFYAEPDNSLDLMCFGTSHAVMGMSPMVLYDNYGIHSYVVGTGSQSISTTASWIREASRHQKNMVALVDIYGVVYSNYTTLEALHGGIDYMKPSLEKIRAAVTGCAPGERDAELFLLPLANYHSRISELTADDLTHLFREHTDVRKGYYPITGSLSRAEYPGVDVIPGETVADPLDIDAGVRSYNLKYLDEICTYCKEKGIPLVLVKFPSMYWTPELSVLLEELAKERGVDFLDMNRNPVYSDTGIDPFEDFFSPDHLNCTGAEKASAYLGNWLFENGYLDKNTIRGDDRVEAKWQKDSADYRDFLREVTIGSENDFEIVKKELSEAKDLVIFYAYQDNGNEAYSPEYEAMVKSFDPGLSGIESRTMRVLCVQDNGAQVCFRKESRDISESGTLEDAGISYEIVVTDQGAGIKIDGTDYAVEKANGLTVVVYSLSQKQVILADCFTPVKGDVYWCVRNS